MSSSVSRVWAHGDEVNRNAAARWGGRLRGAGFARSARADYAPSDDRLAVIVEAIVLRDAAGANVAIEVLESIHLEYVAQNLLVSRGLPARSLGPRAWGAQSVGSMDFVNAFGFRVHNVAFALAVWSTSPTAVRDTRAVALEIAARARVRLN